MDREQRRSSSIFHGSILCECDILQFIPTTLFSSLGTLQAKTETANLSNLTTD